ncbi:MAG: Gfo/Idh/MocA family oxidoreductase [Thermoanaerobaculia bacterium]
MARIAVIGTGWGARAQIPAFRDAGLEIAGIAGSDPEKTRRIAGDLGVEPWSDWREMVVRSEADLISVTAPPSHHFDMAMMALEHERHVLCEKPTAMNAAEAKRMLERATERPQRLSLIDHELRFLPTWQEARTRIAELGELRFAEVRYASPSRSDPGRAWNWWSDADAGGGVWGAVGSHAVDTLRFLVGEVHEAQGLMHTFVAERPLPGEGTRVVTADDFAGVNLRMKRGVLATMLFTAVAGVDEPTVITIHGEEASLRLSGPTLRIAKRGGEWEEARTLPGPRRPGDTAGGWFGTGTFELGRALKRAIDEDDRHALSFAATFYDGLAQQRVLDAARRSHEHGGHWVEVEQ